MPPSQIRTSNGDTRALDQFIRELDATAEQIQKVLAIVRETEVDSASLKTEVRILTDNVREIVAMVRGDDGNLSFATRLVLLERDKERSDKEREKQFLELKADLEELRESLEKKATAAEKSETESKKLAHNESESKWKTYGTLGASAIAMIGTIVTLIFSYLNR